MVSLSALSRIRPAAVLCGGAAAVVAGAWLGPAATTAPSASPAPVSAASSANVSLVAQVTSLAPQDGPGGGLGGPGGSGGDPGDQVTPSPGGHKASANSSGSGGSGSRMTLRGDQQSESMFQKVGHWLGLGGNDSAKSSAPSGPPKLNKPSADQVKQSADQNPAQAGPKQAKPGKAAGGSGGDAKTASKGSAGPDTGGILNSVFSGVSHLLSGIFGL